MKHRKLLQLTLLALVPAILLSITSSSYAAVVNTVPYQETFDNGNSFNNFIVLDNNSDGSTWSWYSYDECARYYYNSTNQADDWLLTPPIRLNAGSTYNLSFNYRRGYSAGEIMEVAFGTGDNPSSYTVVAEPFEVVSSSYEEFTAELVVNETGDYRVGIHALSPADLFYICVDDISITAGANQAAADAPSNFTCTPGAQGTLTAHLTLTAPTTSINSEPLNSLEKIDILCDEQVVHTFTSPSPGASLECDITLPTSGLKTFKAIAYVDNSPGRAAQVQAYVGIDTPLPPTNVRLIDNGKTVTIEWDPSPNVGKNGGYVDVDALLYNVYNYSEDLIGSDLDELSLLDDDMDTETYPYSPMQYYVTAKNDMGESEYAESPFIAVGAKIDLPVSDSFVGGWQGNEVGWWLSTYFVYPVWWASSSMCYDNDNGAMQLWGGEGECTINTGKLMLDNVDNPYLTFAYYTYPGSNNKLEVIGSMMQNNDIVLYTIDDSTLDGEPRWIKAYVSLSEVKEADYTVIRFKGTCANEEESPYIDAVEIKDLLGQDLSAIINVPDAIGANINTPITVTVTNEGGETSGDYTVTLYCNNEEAGSIQATPLNRGEAAQIEFSYTPNIMQVGQLSFYAVVNYDADQNVGNNTTGVENMTVMPNTELPSPQNALFTQNNGASTIIWNEPQQDETVTESFESIAPWNTNFVGLWTLVDQDKGYTCYINGVDHPNMTIPQAYIVYNPEAAGLDLTENYMIAPHSGSQFLGCYATDLDMSDGKPNDDWLISRSLTGEAQQVTLWAKSLFNEYREKFEFLYSTSGTEISNFTLLQTIDEVPDQWTEYSFSLPEGAKHFAVRCVSNDKLLLMLDDITFKPEPLVVIGYNIYLNGDKIGQTDAATLEYNAVMKGDDYTYQITALYAEGESLPVDAEEITAISNSSINQARIRTLNGCILVDGAGNQPVRVYSINGITVYDSKDAMQHTIMVDKGFYIVQVGNNSTRVVVK